MDVGLLIVRLVFGVMLTAHGCQKLFGWFDGPGFGGTGAYFETLGFRPGRVFVVAAGLAECCGGLFLSYGLLQPAATVPIIDVMTVAITTVDWRLGCSLRWGLSIRSST